MHRSRSQRWRAALPDLLSSDGGHRYRTFGTDPDPC